MAERQTLVSPVSDQGGLVTSGGYGPWTPELAGDLQGTHGGVLLCACWQWRLCAMAALDKPRGQAGS